MEVYANKFENSDKMDKFLENFNLPKLTQEEKEILNSPLPTKKIEAAVKTFPTKNEYMNKQTNKQK